MIAQAHKELLFDAQGREHTDSNSLEIHFRNAIHSVFRGPVIRVHMAEAAGIVGEFQSLKAETDADILAMQCGDFYEFFGEDARVVERELDLKVSHKSSGGEEYPMAGVPVDELTPYLRTLIERGFRVAVADQYETSDGHAREIDRVVSPGTFVETSEPSAALVAIATAESGSYGVAIADVTTGRCLITDCESESELLTEATRFEPAEIIAGPELEDAPILDRVLDRTGAVLGEADPTAFASGRATRLIRDQLGEASLETLDLTDEPPAIRCALGGLFAYVDDSGTGVLPALTRVQRYRDREHLTIDPTTRRTLELTEPMLEDGTPVLETIDRTVTVAGHRHLREWLVRPRYDRDTIERRLDRVGAFVDAPMARERLRDHLADLADLARLASRVTAQRADARTLVAIGRTLETIPDIQEILDSDPTLHVPPLVSDREALDRPVVQELGSLITEALRPDPPPTLREGGLFQQGFDSELDELIERHQEAKAWIDSLAEREKARHGITHLQVDRNRTDGFYIQVGNSETDSVPDSYREIKSLKHSKRYTIPELEEREREILRLEDARADLEYELFSELREEISTSADVLQDLGGVLGRLDVVSALATHAADAGWARPALAPAGDPIEIDAGRHPVVETTTEFVPNDTTLSAEERFLLVTGPNMSGKSTYLRQTALIVLLAHCGSFVPADRAKIGLVDGIYTRVGALDELAQGRSTFMVEMQELANILHAATNESLVILDEVGRGTATYDGISIAWAATEFLHTDVEARTLFATHYHELTELADRLAHASNRHVAVDESDGEITFLRTVRAGATDRSYGIHVAKLAGVPTPVRERARTVLDRLRTEEAIDLRDAGPVQAVFDLGEGRVRTDIETNGEDAERSVTAAEQEVLETLKDLQLAELTPLEVFERVSEWHDQLVDD